jgi:hypothetical protein
LGIQPSEIVDTTAAGDSFCGGLLFIFSLYDSLRARFIFMSGTFMSCPVNVFLERFFKIKIWLKVKIFYTKQSNAVITAPVKLSNVVDVHFQHDADTLAGRMVVPI